MRERFGQIGAAIPLCVSIGIHFKPLVGTEECVPKSDQPTMIEWKRQRIRLRGRTDRFERRQISFDRQYIAIAHIAVARIRHRRIQISAIAPNTAANGIEKLLIGILSDARFRIGRDVSAVNRAQGRREREPSGVRDAIGSGVADHAVGGAGKISALFDRTRLLERSRNSGGIGYSLRTQRREMTAGKIEWSRSRNNIQAPSTADEEQHEDE